MHKQLKKTKPKCNKLTSSKHMGSSLKDQAGNSEQFLVYFGTQGIGWRFPSSPSEHISITLGSKGTSKSTKKITNLLFLKNRQHIQNFSTEVLPKLKLSKLIKFTQFHSI